MSAQRQAADERHAAFSVFIRELAVRQARVLAHSPAYYVDVECPSCGAYFGIRNTGFDQQADCPECGRRWSITYDASSEDGTWRGGHMLSPARA